MGTGGNLRGAELPQWTGHDASYQATHARLRNTRGRASDRACVGCDRPATEWAYDLSDPIHEKRSAEGLAYSTDLSRYQPMCRSCHRFHDTTAAGKSACGTEGGYYRHRRKGEPTCADCRAAHTATTRARLDRKTTTITDPDQEQP